MSLDPKQARVWIRELEERLADQPLAFTRREADWVLEFGQYVFLCVECFWRLRNTHGLLLTSEDEGQRFGLPAPINAEEKANALVSSNKVIAATIDPTTADIRIVLTNEIVCEILTNSSGYESWQAYENKLGGEMLGVGANGGLI